MTQKTHTVLYHDACPDGFGSALAAWMVLGDLADYVPVRYGQPPPFVPPEHTLLIVDFSYPYHTMVKLIAEHVQVIMLDHHLGSEADSQQLIADEYTNFVCMHNKDECGATLTWDYYHTASLPPLYEYLRDADLWTWQLPWGREVYAALVTHARTFPTWESYVMQGQEGVNALAHEGQAIRRADKHHIQAMLATLRMVRIGGYDVPAVCAPVLFSEAAHEAMKRVPGALFGAYYIPMADGKTKWGLRGENLVDLNAIAKLYHGGGHYDAASFIVEKDAIQFI